MKPEISVIIPTYNRKELLEVCLKALETQTYPRERIEVIVIDDGSTDTTPALLSGQDNLHIRALEQNRQGQVAALNKGAQIARGEILVFLDDDAVISQGLISDIVSVHRDHDRTVVLPLVHPACRDKDNRFAQFVVESNSQQADGPHPQLGHFTDLIGCCFTVKRTDYFVIGHMQTLPEKLWPDWNDVDFAYRAMKQRYEFWVCPSATVYHYESALSSLQATCERSFNAGRSATRLFKRHPDLMSCLPMFRDKGPVVWRQDPSDLIFRKIARQFLSSPLLMNLMKRSVPFLEHRAPTSTVLALFYRWIISGYIYRGYRTGLQEVD